MLTTKKIAVLMGGWSTEREISWASGEAVEAALRERGYRVIGVEAEGSSGELAQRLLSLGIGIVFIALHGRGGEDGTIQGFLETIGLAYTGSGVLASAVAMDKIMTKRILEAEGLPTPRWNVLRLGEKKSGFSLPAVIKPVAEGSTVGVTIVRKRGEIPRALAAAHHFGDRAIVEEYIPGREVTAAVLDDRPLPLIEIRPRGGFYDFKAKYVPGMTDYLAPAPLPSSSTRQIQDLALRLHRLLGCRGATRVDFRLSPRGRPYILEINTIPGMTRTSLLPKAASCAGIDYPTLVERILMSALRRGSSR